LLLDKIKSHAILLLLVVLIVIVLLVNRPFHTSKDKLNVFDGEPSLEVVADAKEETQQENDTVIVDVKGAVKYPGVYEVASESRVNDVILKAGGLTDEANEQRVNLAEVVYDEMLIYVPTIDELLDDGMTLEQANKIRVNQATAEELQSLSGIGPAKAEAIIQYRDENGPFKAVEDLLNVPGIGQKTLENIVDNIQIP